MKNIFYADLSLFSDLIAKKSLESLNVFVCLLISIIPKSLLRLTLKDLLASKIVTIIISQITINNVSENYLCKGEGRVGLKINTVYCYKNYMKKYFQSYNVV